MAAQIQADRGWVYHAQACNVHYLILVVEIRTLDFVAGVALNHSSEYVLLKLLILNVGWYVPLAETVAFIFKSVREILGAI